jgi:hypothetical protein
MDFQKGEQFLVVAFRGSSGTWGTSVCTGTRLVSYAKDDIDALRARMRGQELSRRVFGHVMAQAGDKYEPLPRVPIILRAPGEEHRTLTDGQGHYRIQGLSAKVYTIETTRSDVRLLRDKEIDLTRNQCAEISGYR